MSRPSIAGPAYPRRAPRPAVDPIALVLGLGAAIVALASLIWGWM